MYSLSDRMVRALCVVVLTVITLGAIATSGRFHASASDLPGLISRWSAEGNANDGVGPNNGTLQGGVTFVSGVIGQAFNFDGIDDRILVNSTFPFHAPGDATLSFWLNTPATGPRSPSVFWTRANDSDLNRFNIFVNPDSTIGFDYRSPTGVLHKLVGECCTGVSIPRSTWTHLAITRTANAYSLYVNGNLAASATDSSPDLPTAIGWQMSGRGGFMYQGRLDEVELYNRALTASEIQSIITEDLGGTSFTNTTLTSSSNFIRVGQPVTFTATVSSGAGTPDGNVEFFDGTMSLGIQTLSGGMASITVSSLTSGQHSIRANYAQTTNYKGSSATLTIDAYVTDQMERVAYWTADGNAVDSVGGHNGILKNGATFATGVVGQAFSFDGSGSHIEVPDSGAWSFGANPFTIELWAQFNNTWGGAFIASSDGPGQERKWIFAGGESGRGLSFHINGAPEIGGINYPYAFLPGQWYHLAVTREGNTFALYIDGVQVTTSIDSVVIPDASAPLTIGEAEDASFLFFNGLLDEIGIYNRALTPAEIKSIFNANAPNSTATIFGIATAGSSQPITMMLSGSQTATTTTDVNGFYHFDGLAANGTYTVTPSKTDFTFTPSSQTFSNLTETKIADFTGNLITDLSLSLDCPSDPVVAGFTLVCTARVHNEGPESVNYTLSAVLPQSVTFLSGTWIENGADCSPDGDHITCTHAGIGVGDTATWEFVLVPTEPGTVTVTTNIAEFEPPIADPNPANNAASTTITVLPLPTPSGTSCVTSPSGLVAWWPGNGNANDIIAGQNGTLQNGATFAAGISGQAFGLDGSSSHVEVPDSSAWSFGANPFTIALWAKFNTPGGIQTLIASDDGPGSQNKWIFWYEGDAIVFHTNSPNYGADTLTFHWSPNLGQWYHLAVTRAAGTYTLHINGIAVATSSDSHAIADASAPLTIGQAEGGFNFNGLLDEIAIYNRALTTAEIQSIFNAGSFGQCKTASFTGMGSNVTVQTDAANFTFDNVSTPGTTSVSAIDPATVGQVPGGFAVSNSIAYEISTTATFTGSVSLVFKVPGPISQSDFNSLAILHNLNGTLVDVTASTPLRDYANLTIYATTNSFSPFYLARKGSHITTLFDQTKAYKSGSTIPIKLQILNATNANISSAATSLVTRDLRLMSGNTLAPITDSGNANPDYTFRYDSTLGGTGGGYIFNLSTKGLAPGQYVLSFYVGSDHSFFYTVKFEVK